MLFLSRPSLEAEKYEGVKRGMILMTSLVLE